MLPIDVNGNSPPQPYKRPPIAGVGCNGSLAATVFYGRKLVDLPLLSL